MGRSPTVAGHRKLESYIMSAIDKVNDPLGPRQASGVNKPGNAAKHSQRSPLVAKDVLELSSHRLEEAERQVEAEFAARKARVIAQEKADQYDPDKAMDQIAKLLAKGYVEHR